MVEESVRDVAKKTVLSKYKAVENRLADTSQEVVMPV